MAETTLRTALWLLLGGWVGSWACFGLVVVPAAFQVLPSTELAGKLVGPVLGTLRQTPHEYSSEVLRHTLFHITQIVRRA